MQSSPRNFQKLGDDSLIVLSMLLAVFTLFFILGFLFIGFVYAHYVRLSSFNYYRLSPRLPQRFSRTARL